MIMALFSIVNFHGCAAEVLVANIAASLHIY